MRKLKRLFKNIYQLCGSYEGRPLGMLETELPDYITADIDYEDKIVKDDITYINTNVSYDAFEHEMIQYMTYDMFNQYFLKWNGRDVWYKSDTGILYVAQVGASGGRFEVTEIERMKRNGNEYEYNVYVNTIYGDTIKKETYYFKLVDIDGTMLVTFIGVG